jgi:hypothetical protein
MQYPARYRRLEAARERFGELADLYGRFLTEVDPLADAVVASFAEHGQKRGRAWLQEALANGIDAVPDAPSSLRALFAQVDSPPSWADFKRMDEGARVFQRCGTSAALTLSAYSLMRGYNSAAAIKPLAFTGQLDAMAPRRLAETGRYILESVKNGGLTRFAPGFAISVRVRVMHAQVRRTLLASGRWDAPSWGAPINQADMATTALEFSSMMLYGTRLLGHRFTHDESEAVMHLWRYAGFLMGVDTELLEEVTSEARGRRYEELVRFVEDGPDQDCVDLARALRKAGERSAKTAWKRFQARYVIEPLHDGLVWVAAGPEVAAALETPHRAFRHAIPVVRALRTPFELLRARIPYLDEYAFQSGSRALREQIEEALGGDEPKFVPVKTVRDLPSAPPRAAYQPEMAAAGE